MKELTEKEALSRVAAFCASAEHCRQEVEEKLQKWEVDEEAIQRILTTLETEKYLDEDRYCRAFVRDKFRFSKWGKLKIKEALYVKGIPSSVAWHHLNEIDEDEYLAVLREVLDSKRLGIRAKDEYEFRAKLVRSAMSRGFELKDIRLCIEIPGDE